MSALRRRQLLNPRHLDRYVVTPRHMDMLKPWPLKHMDPLKPHLDRPLVKLRYMDLLGL